MAKLVLTDVTNLSSNPTAASTAINNNSQLIEDAIENTLSRDGTSPNQMNADLDMNSQRILNLPEPISALEPLRVQDFIDGEIDINIAIPDGDKGDIVVTSDGTVWTVDPVTGTGSFVKSVNPTLSGGATIGGTLVTNGIIVSAGGFADIAVGDGTRTVRLSTGPEPYVGTTTNHELNFKVNDVSQGVFTTSGDLRLTTVGTNAASAVTVGGTQTLTNKTLTSPTVNVLNVTGNILKTGSGVLSVTRDDAATNTPVNIERLVANSTGDMVDGFGPTLSFRVDDTGTTETEIARIDAVRAGADNTGDLVLNAVNAGSAVPVARAVASTSALSLPGGRLQFPATANPSTDANTLDDYEEGLWTPTISFVTPGDLTVVYGAQTGHYTKVGRLVFLNFDVSANTFTHSTASGALQIGGAPFPFATPVGMQRGAVRWSGITKAGYSDALLSGSATGAMAITMCGSGLAASDVAAADMPSGGTPRFSGSYFYIV